LFEKEEHNILDKFDKFVLPIVNQAGEMKMKVKKLPISFYYTKSHPEEENLNRFIWVIKNTGEQYDRRCLKTRLKAIILILKACHLQVTKHLEEMLPGTNGKILNG
jgi:hypothetical protein